MTYICEYALQASPDYAATTIGVANEAGEWIITIS